MIINKYAKASYDSMDYNIRSWDFFEISKFLASGFIGDVK